MKLALGGEFAHRVLPFDEIQPEVAAGRARAGLLIHEGQLTYRDEGLEKCLDLGEWWLLETGLPLPLGVNTVRRDIGDEAVRKVIFHDMVEWALSNGFKQFHSGSLNYDPKWLCGSRSIPWISTSRTRRARSTPC